MELDVGPIQLIKLGLKLVSHKLLQLRLATKEEVFKQTNCGKVKGIKRRTVYDDFYFAFERIPYAKPPIGDLRFRAPQSPDYWVGILDCSSAAPKPMQKNFIHHLIEGSEDCLYLNVYAKTFESQKPLPVMVWLYGGGFQIGEATRDIYAPDYFMKEEVLLVTVNYRLGAFGFLSLDDPDIDVPGNAGLKDQLLALKWVKDNIHYFNGDPNNITLFGESAGGSSAHNLMLSEKSEGLFHKAILQSGTAFCPWSLIPAHNWAYRLAVKCGYHGSENDKEVYRFLAKTDAKKIIANQGELLTEEEKRQYIYFSFGPVIEPYQTADSLILKNPKELLENSWSNKIPIILGGNSFEGLFSYILAHKNKFLIDELGDCEEVLPEELKQLHNKSELKSMGLKLKEAYFNLNVPSFKDTLLPYLDLLSYKDFWHGIHRLLLARAKYATNTNTYLYRFDFDSPFFNHYRILKCGPTMRGVCHADEISYLFYTINSHTLLTNTPEYKTIERMIGMWVSFAKSSNPNCDRIEPTVWQPVEYTKDNDWNCLNISHDVEFKNLPENSKLAFWDSFYTKETLI